MSVQSVILSSAGASGSATGEDSGKTVVSYQSNYRVKCSSALDAASTVLLYFSQNAALPWMGRIFNFGNGFDASVICKAVDVTPVENSGGWFTVTCRFDPIDGQQNQQPNQGITPNGQTSEDPTRWYEEIEVSYSNITEAVDKAVFRGFVNSNGGSVNGNPFFKIDEKRAVTNSANVPYVPGLECENSIRIIRITRNSKDSNLGSYAKYKNSVNSDAFSINKSAYGFRYEARPYFVKFTDFSSIFAIENKVSYWRETKEIQIHPRGWRRQVLDQGKIRGLNEGNKDDAGNTISASDVVDGWVPFTQIKDKDGFPITDPVPFDGKGQPLKSASLPHVYIVYSVEDEIPFSGIQW